MSRNKKYFTQEEQSEIITEYQRKMSLSKLAAKYQVSIDVVRRVLKENNVPIRSPHELRQKVFSKNEIQDIKLRYQMRQSLVAIAKHYSVSQGVISNLLINNGVTIRSLSEAHRSFSLEQEREIIEKYNNGSTASQIAAEYGTSNPPVLKVLKSAGIDLLKNRAERSKKINAKEKSDIKQSYLMGEPISRISGKYGVSDPTIRAALIEQGIQLRNLSESLGGLPQSQIDELIDLYQKGKNTVELAKIFSISNSTVGVYLANAGVSKRTLSEAKGGLTDCQKNDAILRYQAGESSVDIARFYGVSYGTILRVIDNSGIPKRSFAESKILKTERLIDIDDICARYAGGESSFSIAKDYPVSWGTILSVCARNGLDIRSSGGGGDSVQHVLAKTGNFQTARETCYYIYSVNGFPDLLKPGISFDVKGRENKGDGIYGEQLFLEFFASREEAYFLEQAVLIETMPFADIPETLCNSNWIGVTELRRIGLDDLISIIDFYKQQLDELGIWAFAHAYVPMTQQQKHQCIQRIPPY